MAPDENEFDTPVLYYSQPGLLDVLIVSYVRSLNKSNI